MKIHVPGFPTRFVDEEAPAEPSKAEVNPLPSVAEAIARANARQTQVLEYTRQATSSGPPHSINDKTVVT